MTPFWLVAIQDTSLPVVHATTPSPELVAHWPLDGSAADVSGNGQHGTVDGAVGGVDRSGVKVGAMVFDGVDDGIDIGAGVKPDFPFTFSLWVQPNSIAEDTSTNVFRNDLVDSLASRWGAHVTIVSDGRVSLGTYDGPSSISTRRTVTSVEPVLTVGEWTLLTGVYLGHDEMELYVDGLPVNVIPDTGTGQGMGYSADGHGSIGGGFLPQELWARYDGAIDDVRVYAVALDPTAVADLYFGTEPGLSQVSPDRIANAGTVTLTLYGSDLAIDTEVVLASATTEVRADSVTFSGDGRSIQARFGLYGIPTGPYDVRVEVARPDGVRTPAVLDDAVTVELPARVPTELHLIGPEFIRPLRPELYWATVRNPSNFDEPDDRVVLIKTSASLTITSPGIVAAYELPPPEPRIEGDQQEVGVLIPPLRAGETAFIPLEIYAPNAGASHEISVSIDESIDDTSIEARGLSVAAAEANLTGPPPPGGVVFIDASTTTGNIPTGHVAITDVQDGEVVVWDNWLFATRPEISQPVPLEEWKATMDGGAYLGWSTPPGYTEEQGRLAVAWYSSQMLKGKLPFGILGFWPFGQYTCVGAVAGAYDTVGLDVLDPISRCVLQSPGQVYKYLTGKNDFWSNTLQTWFGVAGAPRSEWDAFAACHDKSSEGTLVVAGSKDPNDKVGPPGVGEGRYLRGDEPFFYMIRFENLPDATAPAQLVTIDDVIDPNVFDLSTLELGPIGFGDQIVFVPPGLNSYEATLYSTEDIGVDVDVEVALSDDGRLAWRLMAVDRGTNDYPKDALAGFLPPNASPPEGQGYVTFTVEPLPDLPSGTLLENSASIVFDTNDAIVTNVWVNTIDRLPPTSVVSVVETHAGAVTLDWAGFDEGSGVETTTVYVRGPDGTWSIWLQDTSDSGGIFKGEVDATYAFRAVATDAVGNQEGDDGEADVEVTLADSRPEMPGDSGCGCSGGARGYTSASWAFGIWLFRRRRSR